MSDLGVQLRGLAEGVQAIRQLRDAVGRFSGPLLRVGSPLPYAAAIETGLRGGRPWRRKGAANYLRGAIARVEPRLRAVFADGLLGGTDSADRAIAQAGDALVEEAQRLVPVRSRRLQGSIRAIRTGR